MLKNAYLDTKIGVDPAENEPFKSLMVGGAAARRAGATSRSPPSVRTSPESLEVCELKL